MLAMAGARQWRDWSIAGSVMALLESERAACSRSYANTRMRSTLPTGVIGLRHLIYQFETVPIGEF